MSKTKKLDWWRGEGLIVLVGIVVVITSLVIANIFGVNIIHHLLNSSSTVIYLIIAALVFAEAAIFLGFIIPGEAVVIIGGVLASGAHVSLFPLILVVIIAAIAGDSTGYWVGQKYGKRLIGIKSLEHHKTDIDSGLRMLQKRGAIAVFLARFVAFLRAVMPGLAGASELSYGSFFAANALGGIIWGTLFTFIGWSVGYSYHRAEMTATWISLVLLIAVILIAGYLFLRGRRSEINNEKKFEAKKDNDAILEKEMRDVKNKKKK